MRVATTISFILTWTVPCIFSLSTNSHLFRRQSASRRRNTALFLAADNEASSNTVNAVDAAMTQRYACTRFQRFDGISNSTILPSPSNATVVALALQALQVAQRAPSGFNAQPYKVMIVHDADKKAKLAKHCAGKNAYRVRDSDCTVVFCADKQIAWTFGRYQQLMEENSSSSMSRFAMIKLKCILALFSSGYPLPRFLSSPLSFLVRTAVAVAHYFLNFVTVVPSLGSAETWSTKNTMLVVGNYLVGATARGISTCPMEGMHAGGVRRALGIPSRYAVPLVVATGRAYERTDAATTTTPAVTDDSSNSDDVGMGHGKPGSKQATPRYPSEEVIYGDSFGIPA